MAIGAIDVLCRANENRGDMKATHITLIFVAAAALAGCNKSDHTLTGREPYDPQANAVANAGAVTLPPAIAASKTYRCKDNSLLYIDWYADGSARVKASHDELGTQVPAPAAGAASTLGTAEGSSVTYAGKTCKA